LLFAIAALTLGIMLFQQREILKKRTQTLENAAKDFADSIRHEDFSVASLQDHLTMDAPLKKLAAVGRNRWDELQNTKLDLENTREDLKQTKLELATTKSELGDARNEIARLETDLSDRETQLAEARTRIDDLESQATELRAEIEDLEGRFSELEDQMADVAADLEVCEKERDKLEAKINTGVTTRGVAGRILLVEPTWNFVVLDVGTDDKLVPGAELLVHRGEELIGRVRVTTVQDAMAAAEIITDWTPQQLAKGDFVISPES
jgi:cell shape-determining protein MreC